MKNTTILKKFKNVVVGRVFYEMMGSKVLRITVLKEETKVERE